MIILIGGEKGGAGKSTLAVNLAAKATTEGQDVLLVDADQQASANLWSQIRQQEGIEPEVACIQKQGSGLGRELQRLEERYDVIIIDAGGRDSVELRSALVVSDRALFPLRPSLFDAATLARLELLNEQARGLNGELRSTVVINAASPNARSREVPQLRAVVDGYEGLDVAEAVVRDRVAFRRSIQEGRGVLEIEAVTASDRHAVEELAVLYGEVFAHGR